MKKIALLAGGKLELRYPEDEIALQDGMVKVHVSACGICGSDLALLSGKRDVSKELYFGHEFSGVVTEVSKGSVKIEPGMTPLLPAVSPNTLWRAARRITAF